MDNNKYVIINDVIYISTPCEDGYKLKKLNYDEYVSTHGVLIIINDKLYEFKNS